MLLSELVLWLEKGWKDEQRILYGFICSKPSLNIMFVFGGLWMGHFNVALSLNLFIHEELLFVYMSILKMILVVTIDKLRR